MWKRGVQVFGCWLLAVSTIAGAVEETPLVANPDWKPGIAEDGNTPGIEGPMAPMPPEEDSAAPMSLERIPLSSESVVGWGVVMLDCPVFSKEGKRFSDKAPGGTLVEIEKFTRTSKREEMALCHLWNGDRWFGPFLVTAKSLAMFAGTRADVKADDLENLMEYHRLGAAMARREAALEREAVDANPYAARVRELVEEKNAMARHSEALTKERDQASGSRRNDLTDELRKLQIAAAELTRTLNEQVSLYEKWKKAHPGAVATKAADDPEWRDLDARRNALAPVLNMFNLPGLSGGKP